MRISDWSSDVCSSDLPAAFDRMVDGTAAEDVAILCTTSGTTAHPKLATLPHGRFVRHVVTYLGVDPKDHTDEYVSVLPLPWIMEQIYCVGFGLVARMTVNFQIGRAHV